MVMASLTMAGRPFSGAATVAIFSYCSNRLFFKTPIWAFNESAFASSFWVRTDAERLPTLETYSHELSANAMTENKSAVISANMLSETMGWIP